MKNKQKTVGWKFKDGLFSICYLGPFLIFFTLFTVLPVVISMFLSFTNYNVFETPKFIGFQSAEKHTGYRAYFRTRGVSGIAFGGVVYK